MHVNGYKHQLILKKLKSIIHLKLTLAWEHNRFFSEFYIHLGFFSIKWLAKLFSNCFNKGQIVSSWSKTEVKAPVKLGMSNKNLRLGPELTKCIEYIII